jgi:hypothetical protein
MHLLPTLTAFIPSLDNGTPFKISVHSWEAARPSRLLTSAKAAEEEALFEARIYIDGVLVA